MVQLSLLRVYSSDKGGGAARDAAQHTPVDENEEEQKQGQDNHSYHENHALLRLLVLFNLVLIIIVRSRSSYGLKSKPIDHEYRNFERNHEEISVIHDS